MHMTKKLIDDIDLIEANRAELQTELNQLLKEFKALKIKRGLRSRAAIDALDDALFSIGSDLGYLSDKYWTFLKKVRAEHHDMFDHINNLLGWISIEFRGKMSELYTKYPELDD
jgi:hypothetical protein